ncbi:MAG: hypothetical protein JWP08_3012, partial [Bryobacterales bacterium]|nr:hypothetical protein [Bryobacterales bacterium]
MAIYPQGRSEPVRGRAAWNVSGYRGNAGRGASALWLTPPGSTWPPVLRFLRLLQPLKPPLGAGLSPVGCGAELHCLAHHVVNGLESPIEPLEARRGLVVIRLHFRTDVVLRVLHLLPPDA